jgi:AcrR family transcriptional regulator
VPKKRATLRAAQPVTQNPARAPGENRKRARIGRPPGKDGAETRAAILAAAREQFVRVGYERATNRAIAARAGITAAAIYQYFDSKVDLYVAVATETLIEQVPVLRNAVGGATSAREALAALVRIEQSTPRYALAAQFMGSVPIEMKQHPELARAMVTQPGAFFELIIDIVREGVRNGEIARDKAESVVGMFIACSIGLSLHSTIVGGSHSSAARQGLIDLLEGTLFE